MAKAGLSCRVMNLISSRGREHKSRSVESLRIATLGYWAVQLLIRNRIDAITVGGKTRRFSQPSCIAGHTWKLACNCREIIFCIERIIMFSPSFRATRRSMSSEARRRGRFRRRVFRNARISTTGTTGRKVITLCRWRRTRHDASDGMHGRTTFHRWPAVVDDNPAPRYQPFHGYTGSQCQLFSTEFRLKGVHCGTANEAAQSAA